MKDTVDRLIKKQKETSGGLGFYKDYKKELLSFPDSRELLILFFNHKSFRIQYMQFLLLTVPELWKDFNLDDWVYIIRNVERPKDYRYLFNEEPNFEDIKFLYAYIGIDSVKLYKEDSQLSDEVKNILNTTLSTCASNFFKHGLVEEDFEDGTIGNIKYFKEMRARLLLQGATEAKFKDEMTEAELLSDYIRNT